MCILNCNTVCTECREVRTCDDTVSSMRFHMSRRGVALVANLCALCGSNMWQWMTDAVTVFSLLDNAYVVSVDKSNLSLHVSGESFYTSYFSWVFVCSLVCALVCSNPVWWITQLFSDRNCDPARINSLNISLSLYCHCAPSPLSIIASRTSSSVALYCYYFPANEWW